MVEVQGGRRRHDRVVAAVNPWVDSGDFSIVSGPQAPDRRPGTLRAVVGASAAGVLALDPRTGGPHALVGGTTGAGKSELLQASILVMALTFLVVDYTGGEFKDLPHNVGMVTDLDLHLVRRVLVPPHSELTRREHLRCPAWPVARRAPDPRHPAAGRRDQEEPARQHEPADRQAGYAGGWTEEQDWATFEVHLRAAVHHPSSAMTASLCAALSLKAPEVPNEDTLDVLGEIADPASLACLREILYWDPEWDEYHHLNVKALSAIHKVGTAEGWGLIAAAADHPAAAVADRARTMVDRC